METFLLSLIGVSFSNLLVDCGPIRKCSSNVTLSDGDQFFPYKGGRSWTAENTPTNVARFEGAHHLDFLKNKGKYEVWPELNDQIPVTFCRKYIQKLFRSSYFLVEPRPKKLPSIRLHYTKIYGVNGDSLEHVKLAAVQCYLPKSSKRRHFFYIRAPRTQCVFLVRPFKNSAKSQFVNDFYIINEFCEDIDLNKDVVSDFSQKEHHWNQNTHLESEIGKWNIRGQIKKNTIPVQKNPKRKLLDDAPSETLVRYEREHEDDYLANKDEYKTWPELKFMNIKAVCEKNIEKLFTGSFLKQVYPTILGSAELQYVSVAKKHNQDSPQTVNLSILQCHVPDCSKRRYFFYARTPRPHCLFVVKPIARQKYTAFKIIDEFCERLNINQRKSSLDLLAEVSLS